MATATRGLDFARRILEKYGWEEGKGLGAREDGMLQALRPALKLDLAGVGHAGAAAQFTSRWWQRAYDAAAGDILVSCAQEGVTVRKKNSDKPKSKHVLPPVRTYETLSYESFVKTSLLMSDGTVSVAENCNAIELDDDDENEASAIPSLTDEDIFRACGKRTVHKGARHGLKLSGKLARLARQEGELLGRIQNAAGGQQERERCNRVTEGTQDSPVIDKDTESSCVRNEKEKKKKVKKAVVVEDEVPNDLTLEIVSNVSLSDTKKTNKNKRKDLEHLNTTVGEETEVSVVQDKTTPHKRKKGYVSENDVVIKRKKHKSSKNSSEPEEEKYTTSTVHINENEEKESDSNLRKKKKKAKKKKKKAHENME